MQMKKNQNFKLGETVVYPKHGVGEIINLISMEISSIKTQFYVVKMEQAKLTIHVPLDKQREVGLRRISSKKVIDEVYQILKLKPKINAVNFFLFPIIDIILLMEYFGIFSFVYLPNNGKFMLIPLSIAVCVSNHG